MNPRGEQAEALAAEFLVGHGLAVVARNYRCRGGEIDIIAQDGETLVFVEVRLRRDARFGGAAASITAAKRQRLAIAARHYLGRLGREPFCRFDAVLFEALDHREPTWLRNIDM
jgi:putative endonuclease